MSLTTPDKIRTFQRKLYCKAKAESAFRFYVLYDKICREDILHHAYRLARANAGAPGVDEETFAQIEERGLEAWLAGLREELVSKTYLPDPVRRVMIPKPNGEAARHAARRCREPVARQHLHEPIPEALASNRTWRSIPCPRRLLCRRLRHPQPRLCGGGPGVDEGGDDQARADAQRGQDLAEGRPSGALHVPWLLVRSALVQGEWPMVPGHKPVQEERATAQDNSGQHAGARQQRPMAGSARHAEQISARLVELLLLRDAPVSIPQC